MSQTTKLKSALIVAFTCVMMSSHVSMADDTAPVKGHRHAMVRTPLNRAQLMIALRDAHLQVFGEDGNKNRLASAWAQVTFENGQGKYSYNHNLGNVSPATGADQTYYNVGDKHVYRHFDTFVDGAKAYWEVIKHCKPALLKFDQGNPKAAAAALKKCHYFEADLEVYSKGFVSLYYTAHSRIFEEEQNERQTQQITIIPATQRPGVGPSIDR